MKAMHTVIHHTGHISRNMCAAMPEEVLVFTTSVGSMDQVEVLRPLLDRIAAGADRWSFDLEDRERILRVEAPPVARARIIAVLNALGHSCRELE